MKDALAHLDRTLDRVLAARERLLATPDAPGRAHQLTRLYTAEARAWSQLFELATDRPIWRAALVAEQVARRHAAAWGRRAATEERLPAAVRQRDERLVTAGER